MSVTVKFTLSDALYKELESRANDNKLSVQDYIRMELFGAQADFTPQKAVALALKKYSPGETFTVPELFGDSWNLPNGLAGQFGKNFCKLVEKEYSDKIRFTEKFDSKKHAVYEIL